MRNTLLIILFIISGLGLEAQTGFYYATCQLNSQELKVGRAKLYTTLFSADQKADKKKIKADLIQFLQVNSPEATKMKFFKRKITTWDDVSTDKIYIYGPFNYSTAHSKLRNSLRLARASDWLTISVAGFALVEL